MGRRRTQSFFRSFVVGTGRLCGRSSSALVLRKIQPPCGLHQVEERRKENQGEEQRQIGGALPSLRIQLLYVGRDLALLKLLFRFPSMDQARLLCLRANLAVRLRRCGSSRKRRARSMISS